MKKIILTILLTALLSEPDEPKKVRITTRDTTFMLTYREFDEFLQTNNPYVYMRQNSDTLEFVVGNTQYNLLKTLENDKKHESNNSVHP